MSLSDRSRLSTSRLSLGGGASRAPLGGVARPAALAFAVFQDENEPPVAKKPRLSLKPIVQQQQQQQQQAVRAPLGAMAPPMVPVAVSQQAAPTSELNGGNMRPGYDVSLTVGKDGKEMSFEEARAQLPRYAYRKSALRESAPVPVAVAKTVRSFTPEPKQQSPHQPSPTMCTRSAMNDIDAMFKDSSPVTAPFSTRSLTTEIPGMEDAVAELNSRGRPSPVAFTVFTDEELMTRNIQAAAAYPPLTPILEMSHESDMSHVSNTSMGAPTPASRTTLDAVAEVPAPPVVVADSTIDPFDGPQRDQWIEELGVLASANVTDLTSQASGFDFDALANGTETSLEIGDKLFQVSSVLSVSTGPERVLCLLAENLLDGGEMEVRIAPRSSVLEHQFTASCMARVLESDADGAGAEQMKSLFFMTQESIVYSDVCCSISAVSSRGNLRSLLTAYAATGAQMDEKLVAFYCYDLLKLVHFLHSNQLLHNGLTLDSIWMRFDETGTWSDTWSSSGENGWAGKGVAVSNFISCIDRALFPADTTYRCESLSYLAAGNPTMAYVQQCMNQDIWSEQVDFVSLASIVSQMLFGIGELECLRDEFGQVQLARPLTTAAGTSEFVSMTFAPFFEAILNHQPTVGSPQESLDLLNSFLQHFEMAIDMEVGGQRANAQIKNLLCRQQMMQLAKK